MAESKAEESKKKVIRQNGHDQQKISTITANIGTKKDGKFMQILHVIFLIDFPTALFVKTKRKCFYCYKVMQASPL